MAQGWRVGGRGQATVGGIHQKHKFGPWCVLSGNVRNKDPKREAFSPAVAFHQRQGSEGQLQLTWRGQIPEQVTEGERLASDGKGPSREGPVSRLQDMHDPGSRPVQDRVTEERHPSPNPSLTPDINKGGGSTCGK